ncbi:unnamed protein product [Victoria cruziana]
MTARAGLLTIRLRPAAVRAAETRPTAMTTVFSRLLLSHSFSSTHFPLQYELITFHPVRPPASRPLSRANPDKVFVAMGSFGPQEGGEEMDKSKRKYYLKRRKRMYGSDSDDERRRRGEESVEMQPEVVEFSTLHAREEELYFYDAFAFPWEKDKHYRMVHQLEKKYFPGQGLENAFLQPGEERNEEDGKGTRRRKVREGGENEGDDKRLMFFEDRKKEKKPRKKNTEESSGKKAEVSERNVEVSERKVEEFFRGLSKGPRVGDVTGEPYILTRTDALPARWDGPSGTVVLIDKPKGWTSFTVCGKLRRLVKVQKVGHAGTLDPMATGLLIVCVGKATKQVEMFQDMFKGYSGVFRLGEATSTWDADSPVIQREPWEHIKGEDIKRVAASFCGEIWQVPPMFSAIKVGGEKLYEKARRGETIELSPRRVSIFQFDIERSLDDRQNLIFRVTCSKGTYIRSLCADVGKALGSCAHLTALRRDLIGEYSADDAWEFQELQEQITKGYL